jgi:release factor H-coupled RctB family protein
MGHSPDAIGRAPIHAFYSHKAWIEGAAVDQLHKVAELADVRAVAAMPDLHPGKYGPVGCAILAERVHPEFVGSDIGCGMALFAFDESARKLRLDKAADRLRILGEPWDGDAVARVEEAGLAEAGFAASLGTIGGGNHFCEVQAVGEILDAEAAANAGLERDALCLLVHSGSRGLGTAILVDRLAGGLVSYDPLSEDGAAYLASHDLAVRWAALNRAVIAERAARALRMDARLIVDAPHNLASLRDGGVLHRKGAALASGLTPIAGSRATPSHLVRWTGRPEAMDTLSHGAGRKYDRAAARRRGSTAKSDLAKLTRNPFGGYVVCEDKHLLVEEAPDAYKDCEKVVDDLVDHGLCARVATLKPLVTFKTIREARR